MKKIKAKYPIKCGKILVPKDTAGHILNKPTQRILDSFPNIEFNKGEFLLVRFDFENTEEIIVDKSQIVVV